MHSKEVMRSLIIAGALALAAPVAANTAAANGEWITVHSPSIEGNAEGNAADRTVLVVLPPGYSANQEKRYPVVYFLHGYLGTPKTADASLGFADAVEQAADEGNELILIVPDGDSKHGGAMYSNSPTTGNFEEFIVHELVSYIDEHYRTIARPESRGLAGHSMGGYGTFRLGMRYPGIFSSLYAMSACCLSQRPFSVAEAQEAQADNGAADKQRDFGLQSNLAALAAWSPDPTKPPNYIYSGAQAEGLDSLVTGRLAANAPLVTLAQSVPAMKSYEAIAFDVGNADMLVSDVTAMHRELVRFGIEHDWEIYEGDHGNRIAARLRSHVLPFFGKQLDGEAPND